jgi:hypothetical protein
MLHKLEEPASGPNPPLSHLHYRCVGQLLDAPDSLSLIVLEGDTTVSMSTEIGTSLCGTGKLRGTHARR